MYAEIADLGSKIYDYQIDQITEGDDNIILQALQAAEEEVKSYLSQSNKHEANDGRLRYDVDAIFAKTGAERSPLLLSHLLTIAKWYVVELCNADIIYETAKDRYDRAIHYLNKVATGEANMTGLPMLADEDKPMSPLRYGSRTKFNHEY